MIKGPNQNFKNELIIAQDSNGDMSSKCFDFNLNTFISPSQTKPKGRQLNKLARSGTIIETTLDKSLDGSIDTFSPRKDDRDNMRTGSIR